jgi:RNA:NAD 2'-phosphotransferase (TPT1/KptA family)
MTSDDTRDEAASGALHEAVRDRAKEGRIACAVLRKTAEEFEVSYREAGDAANDEGVKIFGCELGCF